jgi:hypothetical protein
MKNKEKKKQLQLSLIKALDLRSKAGRLVM